MLLHVQVQTCTGVIWIFLGRNSWCRLAYEEVDSYQTAQKNERVHEESEQRQHTWSHSTEEPRIANAQGQPCPNSRRLNQNVSRDHQVFEEHVANYAEGLAVAAIAYWPGSERQLLTSHVA